MTETSKPAGPTASAATTFIPVAEPDLGPLEESYLLDAFRSGWISSLGPYMKRFEEEFAAFCGARHAIPVSNGTVALHLALLAADVRAGDEVIVPAFTFVATAAAVVHAGATPVFVDSEPEIGTMDPVAVAHAVTAKTKAIIPVHLYGHPADMDPLNAIARGHGISVIEDAAEAHGAIYKGRIVGNLGRIGTFSFYGNKIITTGEGGILVTDDDDVAARLRLLRDHAMDPDRRYWHTEVGFNYRMTNLQAAIGCAQLKRRAELLERRDQLLRQYRSAFEGSPIQVNPSRDWARAVPWLVSAVLPPQSPAGARDAAMARLRAEGIDSRPYFHLIHEMPPYRGFRAVNATGQPSMIVAQDLSRRGLNLPTGPRVTPADVARIAAIVRND